jgi:hypothetical protein
MNKNLKLINAIALDYGYILKRRKNHLVYKHLNGKIVVIGKSPSCYRALKNNILRLKRFSH